MFFLVGLSVLGATLSQFPLSVLGRPDVSCLSFGTIVYLIPTKTYFSVGSYYRPQYGIYRDPTKRVGFGRKKVGTGLSEN